MTSIITTGSFKNVAATPFFIPLEQEVDEFYLKNLTASGITAGGVTGAGRTGQIVDAYFDKYMTNGVARVDVNGTFASNIAPISRGVLPQNGITIFSVTNPANSVAIAIQSFTPGTTTVWAATAHGFIVGDTVRVYNLTAAPQFGGLAMTVTAVTTNTFTTLLDSTGATTSTGSAIKIGNVNLPSKALYYPEIRVIAKITNANPMVVTTLVAQNYAAGDVVTFDMPTIFGMPQLSAYNTGLPVEGTVISANNAVGTQTVTIAINSTNFGVFATSSSSTVTNPGHWPLAPGYPLQFPYMVPQGEGNTNNLSAFGVVPSPLPYANQNVLSFAKQNQGANGVLIGAGDGSAATTTGGIIDATHADVWAWLALTSLQTFP